MPAMRSLTALAFGLAMVTPAAAEIARPSGEMEAVESQAYEANLFRHGDVWISGYPSVEDLTWARSQGVTTIVSLMSEREIEARGVTNTQAYADALGLGFTQAPVGWRNPPEPETLERVNAVLDRADGDVLIHCYSAGRATSMWRAVMIERGWATDEEVDAWTSGGDGGERVRGLLGREDAS